MTDAYPHVRDVLDAIEADTPPAVEVAERLADARDLDVATAQERVYDAIDAGVLVEEGDGFGGIRLAEDVVDEPTDTVEEEGGSPGSNPGVDTDKSVSSTPESDNIATNALATALEWYHEQLDRELPDAVEYETPREYYREGRGWSDETIDGKCLGFAPANHKDELIAYLFDHGYDREAILSTGLFGERDDGNLYTTWSGRYVLPYFDDDGNAVFAISRATEPVHSADWKGNKYDKLPVSREAVDLTEPIYGLETVREGEPVLITEGIADAITAHQAGYACLSPVTTSFKKSDRERLVDALEARDVPRVYIIQDAERPTSDLDDRERLSLQQFGDGVEGAVRTAAYLSTHGIDARIGDLPRLGLDKVDLDDYLRTWSDDLAPILASAVPVEQHPAYDDTTAKRVALDAADASDLSRETTTNDGSRSALFDLGIRDVTGLSWDYRGTNPLGHHGDSENYFVLVEDYGVAYDFKYKVAYNGLTYLLVDAGERRPDAPNGSLDDGEIFAGWEHAKRERLIPEDDSVPTSALQHIAREATEWDGDFVERETRDGDTFDALPRDVYNAALDVIREEYGLDPGREPVGAGAGPDAEPVAVLPQSVRDLSHATTGFDWRHTARQGSDTLTLEDARERATDTIADAYQYGDRVLVEALPAIGKSYGSVKAAAETGEDITVLTLRGHKEQYAQLKKWCDEFGLSYYQLPSFTRDCDTANGEHGDEWADTVEDWYSRGATPKEIHKNAEYELGRPLPCQAHEGESCPYTAKWDFDPDDYDVLIGHYSHAYREEKVVSGRTVVLDEFPGAYEESLGANLQGAVSYWLQSTDGVPFEDYTDLLENRSDESRRADALLWFEEHGVEPDETGVFDSPNAHAAAPIAVFTILASDDLGNGFEKADVDGVGTGVRNRANDTVSILRPPAFDYASGVVALDGTPTKELWELALGERLNHRAVLQDDERAEYIREALNLNLVRTSEYVKPYNSKDHVNTESDGALLEEIGKAHGEQPGLITSSTAISEYKEADVLDLVDGSTYYGNVLGSNEFKEKRLGAVIGSNHYGDGYIKKWGAYAGKTVERNDEKGAELSYGAFGDKVLTHMREHDTLQAVMRFGRDGNGSVVYVHTDTLPEWVPLAGEGRVVNTWSDGMKAVVRTLETLESATTAKVAEAVDLSRQQVFEHLEALRERGVLDREQDETDGRRFVWVDDGLHRIGEHGEAELEPVDLEDLDESEVRQVARSSIYTWEFTNRDADTGRDGRSDAEVSSTTSKQPATGGGGPPDSD